MAMPYDPTDTSFKAMTTPQGATPDYFMNTNPATWANDPNLVKQYAGLFGNNSAQAQKVLQQSGTVIGGQGNYAATPEQIGMWTPQGQRAYYNAADLSLMMPSNAAVTQGGQVGMNPAIGNYNNLGLAASPTQAQLQAQMQIDPFKKYYVNGYDPATATQPLMANSPNGISGAPTPQQGGSGLTISSGTNPANYYRDMTQVGSRAAAAGSRGLPGGTATTDEAAAPEEPIGSTYDTNPFTAGTVTNPNTTTNVARTLATGVRQAGRGTNPNTTTNPLNTAQNTATNTNPGFARTPSTGVRQVGRGTTTAPQTNMTRLSTEAPNWGVPANPVGNQAITIGNTGTPGVQTPTNGTYNWGNFGTPASGGSNWADFLNTQPQGSYMQMQNYLNNLINNSATGFGNQITGTQNYLQQFSPESLTSPLISLLNQMGQTAQNGSPGSNTIQQAIAQMMQSGNTLTDKTGSSLLTLLNQGLPGQDQFLNINAGMGAQGLGDYDIAQKTLTGLMRGENGSTTANQDWIQQMLQNAGQWNFNTGTGAEQQSVQQANNMLNGVNPNMTSLQQLLQQAITGGSQFGNEAGQNYTGTTANVLTDLLQGKGVASDQQNQLTNQLMQLTQGGGLTPEYVNAARDLILKPKQEAMMGQLNQLGGGQASLDSPAYQEMLRRNEQDFTNQLIMSGQGNLSNYINQAQTAAGTPFAQGSQLGNLWSQLAGQTTNQGQNATGQGINLSGQLANTGTSLAQLLGNLGIQNLGLTQQGYGQGTDMTGQISNQALNQTNQLSNMSQNALNRNLQGFDTMASAAAPYYNLAASLGQGLQQQATNNYQTLGNMNLNNTNAAYQNGANLLSQILGVNNNTTGQLLQSQLGNTGTYANLIQQLLGNQTSTQNNNKALENASSIAKAQAIGSAINNATSKNPKIININGSWNAYPDLGMDTGGYNTLMSDWWNYYDQTGIMPPV
jgi:hypothetical protein